MDFSVISKVSLAYLLERYANSELSTPPEKATMTFFPLKYEAEPRMAN